MHVNPTVRRHHRAATAVAAGLASFAVAACAGPVTDEDTVVSAPSSVENPDDHPSDPATESLSPPPPSNPGSTPEPTKTAEAPTGPSLVVTIDGDDVGPNAAEINLKVGEPLVITFETDRGGQLHVHSKPEQYVDFAAGKSTDELVVTTPGTVEIEEHDTEAVVAVLQVR